jgi:putative transposase
MPRRARLTLANIPLHIIQRGNNRQACFFAEEDYHLYLGWLAKYAHETGCRVHSYVLMTNHVHLLISADWIDSASLLMKALGQRYVQYINRTYRRSGTLWEGRYKSCLVQEEAYLLTCQRYIELNPVRAGMVRHPEEYCWSSYLVNANGVPNELIRPHPIYEVLGLDVDTRQAAYRELFKHEFDSTMLEGIRRATNGNFVLGGEQFAAQISSALGRRVVPGKLGRPRKTSKSESEQVG